MIHQGPTHIGIDTIYRSRKKLPLTFLRGCGVLDEEIKYFRERLATSIKYFSCFISYSFKDQEFAERLYSDLQESGVRCWFAPEDLKIGDKLRPRIDESIRIHDKLLLVLSKTSVISQWVEQEVETALAKEREQRRTLLFPIRLDDTVMEINGGWPTLIKNTRYIGDFKGWRDHELYRRS